MQNHLPTRHQWHLTVDWDLMAALVIFVCKALSNWVIAKWLKLILIVVLNLYIVFVVLVFFSWVLVEPSWRMGARRALLKKECSSSPLEEWVLVEPSWRRGARRALLKNGCSSSPLEEWVLVEPSWRMGARRALLNVEGQPNLSDLIIISADLLP
jgi:hypothetical protein